MALPKSSTPSHDCQYPFDDEECGHAAYKRVGGRFFCGKHLAEMKKRKRYVQSF